VPAPYQCTGVLEHFDKPDFTARREYSGNAQRLLGTGFYGAVCAGMTLVSFCVNSNRSCHSLATLFPFTSGGVKAHFLAACKARSAKNRLGPGESNSASDTPPDGSTRTFTLTRTFPWMVARAFCETSGKTWSRTSPLVEAIPPATGFGVSREAAVAAEEAARDGCSFSLVVFNESGVGAGAVR
jgi:hypothetical protein